jgi:serine/threonine protein kinase
MSPEQARGENNVDSRTDIWALCVVLYEMIVGAQPFSGKNWHGLMWAIMEGKPKALAEHELEEPALWTILQRGLSKEREHRFSSMFEFGQALAVWLVDQGVTRDICNSSLKSTWLERSADSSVALHSFFPSDAPRSSDAKPPAAPVIEAPRGKVAGGVHGVVLASKSRIRRSFSARNVSAGPARGSKAWLVVTVLGAVLSFTAAVAFSLSSASKEPLADEDDALPNITVRQPSKDLGIRTRRDLLPGAPPAPALRLSDELDTLHEARVAARPSTPAKKPAKSAAIRPTVKKPPADLKDPFGEVGE